MMNYFIAPESLHVLRKFLQPHTLCDPQRRLATTGIEIRQQTLGHHLLL